MNAEKLEVIINFLKTHGKDMSEVSGSALLLLMVHESNRMLGKVEQEEIK